MTNSFLLQSAKITAWAGCCREVHLGKHCGRASEALADRTIDRVELEPAIAPFDPTAHQHRPLLIWTEAVVGDAAAGQLTVPIEDLLWVVCLAD